MCLHLEERKNYIIIYIIIYNVTRCLLASCRDTIIVSIYDPVLLWCLMPDVFPDELCRTPPVQLSEELIIHVGTPQNIWYSSKNGVVRIFYIFIWYGNVLDSWPPITLSLPPSLIPSCYKDDRCFISLVGTLTSSLQFSTPYLYPDCTLTFCIILVL